MGASRIFSLLKAQPIHVFVDKTFSVVSNPFKQPLIVMVKEAAHELNLPEGFRPNRIESSFCQS
jgi:hypothetical protein